jgi:redox-sensitive bicupin YhaK (pirin superfamily)
VYQGAMAAPSDSRAGWWEVRRAADRFVTEAPGRTTWHSFSFDRHYDPGNVALGFLVSHNDDRVEPGAGYPDHPHRELEIVTWVLEGALRHEDSTGRGGVVVPGTVQRMSAGTGVRHSEVNDGPGPVHFVQMWVQPDESGRDPSYAQRDVGPALAAGGWVTLASGIPAHAGVAAVPLGNARAGLHAARLPAGGVVTLPEAPVLHVFVARGSVEVEGVGGLATGDALRLATGGRGVATPTGAELLVWEMAPER